MVRLVDIAKVAKVSQTVVSAVLNGGASSSRVSEKKRAEIEAIAKRLNYVPNNYARRLRGKSSMTIGVLRESDDAAIRFRQLHALELEAERHGYRLLVAEAHRNPKALMANYRSFMQYGVDGVVIHANGLRDEFRKIPKLVVFGAEPVTGLPSIYYDMTNGYTQALESFKAAGKKRVALIISKLDVDSVRARRNTFLKLLPEAKDNIIELPYQDPENIREIMSDLLKNVLLPRKIDAVIMLNDLWAMALLGQALKAGLRVPEDLAIIGQDNSDIGLSSHVSLSSVDPNPEGLGKAIMELMLERISHPEREIRSIGVDTWLVNRESSAYK
jgi:DNA-binding LacI/PurR family transcriptional regulator